MTQAASARLSQTTRLAALVVTHNRLDQLRATVARLLSEPLDHLLVVNNGATDGTGAWLAEQTDPRLDVLDTGVNLGGAGGFAAGMAHARDRIDADWLVLMDDDARPWPGALALFRGLDLTAWDALSAAVRYPDGSICEMNRPIVNRLKRRFLFVPRHLGAAEYDGAPRAIAAASFVGCFLSRHALRTAPLPDPDLFLYMDDGLYTLALSRGGFRLGFAPDLVFEHDCQSLVHRMTGFRPVWRAYYYHRNLALFYRRAMGPLFWPVFAGFLLPRWIAKVRDQKREALPYLRHLARAVVDGVSGRLDRPPRDIPGPRRDPKP